MCDEVSSGRVGQPQNLILEFGKIIVTLKRQVENEFS